MFSLRCTLCFILLVLSPISWGDTLGQPAFTLQRFLDANPSQQPLQEQLAARVHSPPIPLISIQPDTQKIALVLRGEEHETKNRAWLITFKRRMQEINLGFRLDLFFLPKDNDVDTTARIFKTIEYSSFDYLIMDGVDEFSHPALDRILRRGSTKVIMLNMVVPIASWRNHGPLLYIGIDVSQTMARLASYVDRRLPEKAVIDVLAAKDAYINETRCQVFMNELQSLGRNIREHYVVTSSAEEAKRVVELLALPRGASDNIDEHFVFSCTPELSQGVLQAKSGYLSTNAWLGQPPNKNSQSHNRALVTVLDMYDNMAIATAEAIKASIESRLLPAVYTESTRLLSQEMDSQTRDIMFQQAFRYSLSIWPR